MKLLRSRVGRQSVHVLDTTAVVGSLRKRWVSKGAPGQATPLHLRRSSLRADFPGVPSMGTILEVQVLPRADHSERSEMQLREGDRAWGGSK